MKSSLKKLRGFSLGKNGGKEDKQHKQHKQQKRPLLQPDELAQASQDIQDMRECYDGLMAASALTANRVYEFSEALQEMGSCLLEKTALSNEEESGRVLIMLGKVQYELHKILDRYRTHITQTVTAPSDTILSELQFVEEMKKGCDEKRKTYETIRAERTKGKSKTVKGETTFSSEQLQSAKEAYESDVTFLVCRLMSMKQGQPRSLLTQAARHYSAQLHLFRKGLASLEALEPQVKKIAEHQHIDYQFSELEEDDGEVSYELSQDPDYDESTSSENSMQLDKEGSSSPRTSQRVEPAQSKASLEEIETRLGTARRSMVGSKSAPLIPSMYGKSDRFEKIQDTQPSTIAQRNLHTYALPIPVGGKSGNLTGGGSNTPLGSGAGVGTGTLSSSSHTVPLGQYKTQTSGTEISSIKNDLNIHESAENSRTAHLLNQNGMSRAQPLPEEPTISNRANILPVRSTVERVPVVRFDIPDVSDSKRIKRQAFSGPLTNKLWSSRSSVPGSGPLVSKQVESSFKSGPVSHSSVSNPFGSSKTSPSVSPPNLSPTRMSELYELPKPPIDSTKSAKSSMIAHSAPLAAKKNQEGSTIQKPGLAISKPASPLPPPPPGLGTRSMSIPSSAQRRQILQLPKITDISDTIQLTEEVPSPPLTPIPFPSSKGNPSAAKISERAGESSEVLIVEPVHPRERSPTSEQG